MTLQMRPVSEPWVLLPALLPLL